MNVKKVLEEMVKHVKKLMNAMKTLDYVSKSVSMFGDHIGALAVQDSTSIPIIGNKISI